MEENNNALQNMKYIRKGINLHYSIRERKVKKMLTNNEFEAVVLKKVNNLNMISLSKGERGTLKTNEYTNMSMIKIDSLGRSVCLTCGKVIKDNLIELAQIEEAKGYTAINVIPVCQGCYSVSRGQDLKQWYNSSFKRFDVKREQLIKQIINNNRKEYRL